MTIKRPSMCGNKNASKGHEANLRIRCKPADKAAWTQQSKRENRNLTAWVAATLNKALEESQHE